MGLQDKRTATEMGKCPDKIFLIKFSKTKWRGEGVGGGCHPPLHVWGSLLHRRFVFRMTEASAKREGLVINRKGPWEGYSLPPIVSFPPSSARTFSSKERRLGTRQRPRANTKILEVAWDQALKSGKRKNGVKQQKLASEAGWVVDWRRGSGATLSPRLPLTNLVTQLRIQRNDGWGFSV